MRQIKFFKKSKRSHFLGNYRSAVATGLGRDPLAALPALGLRGVGLSISAGVPSTALVV